MATQVLLSVLFLTTGIGAAAVIFASVRHALPQVRALKAALASADPVREISWKVTSVDVRREPASVSLLPVTRKAALPRQQQWLAAA
jgi:hypothetical protein